MAKVTRIYQSEQLNRAKFNELSKQAALLGKIRQEVWQRYGSIKGVGISHRTIRNEWVRSRDFTPLAAKAWKETLRDVIDDIKLYEEAAKEKVRTAIWKHSQEEDERRRLLGLLKGNGWVKDAYLRRKMRAFKRHGKTQVKNQIIVEEGVYRQFIGRNGNTWLKISSLVRGKMLCIPLNSNVVLNGCLRLILKNGIVYVHHTLNQKAFNKCGDLIVGVDKGYSEAFADSEGNFYGVDFGSTMTKGSAKRHTRGQARNKLYQIAKKNPKKAASIYKYNLGRKKLESNDTKQKNLIRNIAFQAAHAIVNIAGEVRAEDLSRPFSGRATKWKAYNRKMSAWARSTLAEALYTVCRARGSCLRVVNCAYTSQVDSKTNLLQGRRVGDKFYHANGDVSHADTNAAVNIKVRGGDTAITLYTPHQEVKKILLDRLAANRGVSEALLRNRPSRTPVAPGEGINGRANDFMT